MRIAIIVEGNTEKAFIPSLRAFLHEYLAGNMPKLDPTPVGGRLPKGEKLRTLVQRLLTDKKQPADAVIALTDVYTGTRDFTDAEAAKSQLRSWVGPNDRFHPHAAQYDFEAWLLPYWERIQQLAKSNRDRPSGHPESVNHDKPPAKRLQEVFRTGSAGRSYMKTRDAGRILEGQRLEDAASQCPELKAFLNTILGLCEADPLP